VPCLAGWISPTFQLKANRIINNFYIQDYKSKLETAQREAEAAQQDAEVAQQHANQLHDTLMETDAARMQVEEDLAARRTEWQKWRQSHSFTILKLNDAGARYPYYVIRCRRATMNGRIKMLRKKHPRALVIFQHKKVPNGVNLYNRLKTEKLVLSNFNYCIPHNNEATLLAALNQICGVEYPAEVNFPINLYVEPIAPTSPTDIFTQLASFEPAHVITYTPPSSPPASPPPASPREQTFLVCNYCNKEEPSLWELYMNHQVCMFSPPRSVLPASTVMNNELHSPWSQTHITRHW